MPVLKRVAVFAVFSAVAAFAADPALMNLMTPEARVVMGINVEQAKNTPFGQSLLNRMQREGGEFAQFVASTGFDPRRDLREVLVGSTANQQEGGLVVARGFFNPARLTDFARQQGATVTNYQGVEIIQEPSAKAHKGAFAILDASTAIGGDLGSVKAAIDRRGKGIGLGAQMQSKINDLSTRNDAWFASTVPGSDLASRVRDPRAEGIAKGEIFQAVEQSSGGVKFGNIVQITGEALMRSDKDATALADVARFLGSMIQVNKDKAGAANIATLMEQMDIKTEANVVKFSLAVPQDQLEKIITPARARRTAQR